MLCRDFDFSAYRTTANSTKIMSSTSSTAGVVAGDNFHSSTYAGRRTLVELSQVTFLKPSLEEYDVCPDVLDERQEADGTLANIVVADRVVTNPRHQGKDHKEDRDREPASINDTETNNKSPPIILLAFSSSTSSPSASSSSSHGGSGSSRGSGYTSGSAASASPQLLAAANDAGEVFVYDVERTSLERSQQALVVGRSPATSSSSAFDHRTARGRRTRHGKTTKGSSGLSSSSSSKIMLRRKWQAHPKEALITALNFPPRGPPQHVFTTSLGSATRGPGCGEAKLWNSYTGELLVCYEDSMPITCAGYLPLYTTSSSFSGAHGRDGGCGTANSIVNNAPHLLYATAAPAVRLISTQRHAVVQKLKMEAEVRCLAFEEEAGRFTLLGGANGCIYVIEAYARGGGGGGGANQSGAFGPGNSSATMSAGVTSSFSASNAMGLGMNSSTSMMGSSSRSYNIHASANNQAAQPIAGPSPSSPSHATLRLRPMLVQFQYDCREITSLKVQPRLPSKGRPPLLLVNCLASDAVGLLELQYRNGVLIMLQLLQRVSVFGSNQFLPMQSLFCCEHFAVSGTEERPGVLQVLSLDGVDNNVLEPAQQGEQLQQHLAPSRSNASLETISCTTTRRLLPFLESRGDGFSKSSSSSPLARNAGGEQTASSSSRGAYQETANYAVTSAQHNNRHIKSQRNSSSSSPSSSPGKTPAGRRSGGKKKTSSSSPSTSTGASPATLSHASALLSRTSLTPVRLSARASSGTISPAAASPRDSSTLIVQPSQLPCITSASSLIANGISQLGRITQASAQGHLNGGVGTLFNLDEEHVEQGMEGDELYPPPRARDPSSGQHPTNTMSKSKTMEVTTTTPTTAAPSPVEAGQNSLSLGSPSPCPSPSSKVIDAYPLSLAVNPGSTILAVGDTHGGITLLRRTATRRRPD
ncbi:unnamed protein product [Amoebophrya sp. A25]|nr:unnamed protein product [Amoebophrya sp. A25]|eukprot:GSA25T00020405001.1